MGVAESPFPEHGLAGDVVLTTPLFHRVIVALFVALGVSVLTFLSFATFSGRETVGGWITPSSGLINVSSPQAGIVEKVLAAEGAEVNAQQPIAVIRLSPQAPDGSAAQRLAAAVASEDGATIARESTQIERLKAERNALLARRSALQSAHRETLSRIENQRQQVAIAEEEVERVTAIANRGFYPVVQLQARRANVLSTKDYLGQLRAIAIDQARQIGDIGAELRELPLEALQVRAETAQARATIAQRQIGADAQDREVVTSPVSGKVLALPRQPGQAVAAWGAVALVAPAGSRLEAELYIPSRAAGFVRVGQLVRVKYAAFPHRRFGAAVGRIESVSRTVLPPAEASSVGVKADEPVFRARVRLDEQDIIAYGQHIPLQPGMLLQGDIILGKRSLLAWLYDPIRAKARS